MLLSIIDLSKMLDSIMTFENSYTIIIPTQTITYLGVITQHHSKRIG